MSSDLINRNWDFIQSWDWMRCNDWLVVWNIFVFPYIGNNHPNWLIFFRGVETTNQFHIDMTATGGGKGQLYLSLYIISTVVFAVWDQPWNMDYISGSNAMSNGFPSKGDSGDPSHMTFIFFKMVMAPPTRWWFIVFFFFMGLVLPLYSGNGREWGYTGDLMA